MEPAVRKRDNGGATAAAKGLVWWVCAVYLVSFSCYVPMLLARSGAEVPGGLLALRYGFVLTPALVSGAFLLREHSLGAGLRRSFKAVSLREAAACLLAALLGVLVTAVCSRLGETDLFHDAYPSAAALAAGCVYLFATAVIEEAAWRGFLLRRIAAVAGRSGGIVLTGVIWAVWHIPMWSIRNALGLADIVPLLIWALLISVVLGVFFDAFGNVLSAALLHTAFNVCFLAPIQYNIALLLLIVLAGGILRKRIGADPAKDSLNK